MKYVGMRKKKGILKFVNPGWLVADIVKEHLQACANKYAKGKLLDIGCGTKPYESVFKPYITTHIGLDHEGMVHDCQKVDIFADAYNIPLDDETVDTVLCSEVLEHLEEPKHALKEMYRVLSNGGISILTMPFAWHLHEEPRDFFRYTKHGIKHLAHENGFMIEEIRNRGGLSLVLFTEVAYCIDTALPFRMFVPFKWVFFLVWQHIACLLNIIDPTKEFFPLGYTVVLRKEGLTPQERR